MELLTIQHLKDARPTHIIAACEDSDTCPGCGAGYRVGLSVCEYCRRPVRFHTGGPVPADFTLAMVHAGEAIVPRCLG